MDAPTPLQDHPPPRAPRHAARHDDGRRHLCIRNRTVRHADRTYKRRHSAADRLGLVSFLGFGIAGIHDESVLRRRAVPGRCAARVDYHKTAGDRQKDGVGECGDYCARRGDELGKGGADGEGPAIQAQDEASGGGGTAGD